MNILEKIIRYIRKQKEQSISEKEEEYPNNFVQFIWAERKNRQLLWVILFAITIQFIIFKIFYPFADFFSDSYSYIFAASANLDINVWPIGYSKFLKIFHFFTSSDVALTGFQYFFLELCAIYFLYTIYYFYKLSKSSRYILIIFLFFNPLFLYISNYVNSDPLFAALSLIWFTQLLWLIHRPATHLFFTHGIVLFICFTVRNNAYYYPFISLAVILLSTQKFWVKFVGIALPAFFIIPFIIHTRDEAFKLTGRRQFSLFTGWQLANNALYMRGNIVLDSTQFPSFESKELDRIAINFYKRTPNDFDQLLSSYVGNYFIRQPESPLKQYYNTTYHPRDERASISTWGQASAVFEDYGKYLIRKKPIDFTRHFLLLNIKNYISPPLEKLEVYNLGMDEVSTVAQDWFNYKSSDVSAISKTIQGSLLAFYPSFFMLVNVYFIGALFAFLVKRKHKIVSPSINRSLLLVCCFGISNFFFCVFATIIVFRYQFFPLIVLLPFALLLADWVWERKAVAEPDTGYSNIENKKNILFDKAL